MNHFEDQGIVISVRRHGENGAIVSCLTQNNGFVSAYVNGAQSSSRLRSTLQQGNIVSIDWQSKSEGQMGRFDLEVNSSISTVILSDSKALMAIQSVCSLISMFLPEREKHEPLFNGTVAFLNILKVDEWPAAYVMWELAFLKELGYGIDLSCCVVSGNTENLTHVSPKSGRAVCATEAKPYSNKLLPIPQFLQGNPIVENDVETGLNLTGYFLIHRLLQYSSYQSLPKARISLENTFNLSNMAA